MIKQITGLSDRKASQAKSGKSCRASESGLTRQSCF